MDYIEREAALAQTHEINIAEVGYRHRSIDPQAIREIPAADVVPVVHGEWGERNVFEVDPNENVDMLQSAKCSKCGKYHTTPYMYYFTNYPYCPNCGARMDGDVDES